jgi:hypothetical protein
VSRCPQLTRYANHVLTDGAGQQRRDAGAYRVDVPQTLGEPSIRRRQHREADAPAEHAGRALRVEHPTRRRNQAVREIEIVNAPQCKPR